jgi:hypothetical protein
MKGHAALFLPSYGVARSAGGGGAVDTKSEAAARLNAGRL